MTVAEKNPHKKTKIQLLVNNFIAFPWMFINIDAQENNLIFQLHFV